MTLVFDIASNGDNEENWGVLKRDRPPSTTDIVALLLLESILHFIQRTTWIKEKRFARDQNHKVDG